MQEANIIGYFPLIGQKSTAKFFLYCSPGVASTGRARHCVWGNGTSSLLTPCCSHCPRNSELSKVGCGIQHPLTTWHKDTKSPWVSVQHLMPLALSHREGEYDSESFRAVQLSKLDWRTLVGTQRDKGCFCLSQQVVPSRLHPCRIPNPTFSHSDDPAALNKVRGNVWSF